MKIYQKTNGRLSEEDQEDCLRRVAHDFKLEGMDLTDYEISLARLLLAGEITGEEFSARILSKAGL